MTNKNQFDVPTKMPPWLQGVMLGLVFGLVLFADAITMWLS